MYFTNQIPYTNTTNSLFLLFSIRSVAYIIIDIAIHLDFLMTLLPFLLIITAKFFFFFHILISLSVAFCCAIAIHKQPNTYIVHTHWFIWFIFVFLSLLLYGLLYLNIYRISFPFSQFYFMATFSLRLYGISIIFILFLSMQYFLMNQTHFVYFFGGKSKRIFYLES